MSNDAAWQCLSVDEFISRCNWNVLPQISADSAIQLKSLASWQCLTTQNLFALNNWTGQVILSDTFEQREITKQTIIFDLTLVTRQFWQCFNWSKNSSRTVNQADEAIENAIEAVVAIEKFTLNDLSQLF